MFVDEMILKTSKIIYFSDSVSCHTPGSEWMVVSCSIAGLCWDGFPEGWNRMDSVKATGRAQVTVHDQYLFLLLYALIWSRRAHAR